MSQRVLTFLSSSGRELLPGAETMAALEARSFRFRAFDAISDLLAFADEAGTSQRRLRYPTRGASGRDDWAQIANIFALPSRPNDQRLAERIRREHLADAFASRPLARYRIAKDLVGAIEAALLTVGVRVTSGRSAQTLAALHEVEVPSAMAIVTLREQLGSLAVSHVVFLCEAEGELLWVSRLGAVAPATEAGFVARE